MINLVYPKSSVPEPPTFDGKSHGIVAAECCFLLKYVIVCHLVWMLALWTCAERMWSGGTSPASYWRVDMVEET